MGLYLKGALDMGADFPSNKDGLVPSQKDLRDTLAKIWNNQDNLTKEDIQTLEHLSKK
jgi:hypothetical protein